jgi:hypothetical protein
MKTLQNQSLLDIAIQALGAAEAAFDIALLNNLSITDTIAPGLELTLPAVVNTDIASYYAAKGLRPATGIEISAVSSQHIFDTTFDNTFN